MLTHLSANLFHATLRAIYLQLLQPVSYETLSDHDVCGQASIHQTKKIRRHFYND